LKFLADVNISEEDSIHSFGEHFMKSANLLKRISIEPTVMLGKPVIKGTRMPVDLLVEKLAFGTSTQELLADYPFLTADDIKAALLYSARCVSVEEVYAV
jgi:uncharacterized protein (DUF433 family)